jgi:predicted MFS family arabinose efflux permease
MRFRELLAVNALSIVGNGCLVVQPIVVGALVDRLGYTERQAGFVASLELAGLAVAFVVLFAVAHRINRSVLAFAGIATVVVANIAACFIHQFAYMALVQFVVGMGCSMAFSAYLTIGAAQEHPEKLFAIVNAVSIAYSGVFLPIAPAIVTAWQLPGIFLTLAVIAIVASATIPWLPPVQPQQAATALHGKRLGSSMPLLSAHVIMVLLMMLFLYTGHGAVWAYQERIGVSLGMPSAEVGKWLGASMLIWGVIGSMLARVLGMRIGRIWPQTLSLGISIIAALLLVFGTTPGIFAFACGLIALSWFYGLPYQMGLLAEYDRRGRLNMIGTTMTTSGCAIGPAIAAVLVGSVGHWTVGVLAGACYLAGLILVLPAAIELARGSGALKHVASEG